MNYFGVFFFLLVISVVCLEARRCRNCNGDGYECIKGRCQCADGYVSHPFHDSCYRCPDVGESCHRHCCSHDNSAHVRCIENICHQCFRLNGAWVCNNDEIDSNLMVRLYQVIVGASIVVAVLLFCFTIYKVCFIYGSSRSNNQRQREQVMENRNSLRIHDLYINQKLKDAPPRYLETPSAPSEVLAPDVPGSVNHGFVHDNSIPPPAYSKTDVKRHNISNDTSLHL